MGPETGVQVTEFVSSPDPNIQAAINSGAIANSNNNPHSTDRNGTVPDVQGAISHDPANLGYLGSGKPFTINQRVTVTMPNPDNPSKPQGVFFVRGTFQITPTGVTGSYGAPTFYPRK
jgi:hypothetical protein